MNFLENDLEEIIFKSNPDDLEERGLLITGKLKRQLRISNYGIADLVEYKTSFHEHYKHKPILIITVYELKKDKIGISSFLQAVAYIKGIKNYIEKNTSLSLGDDLFLNIKLIGKRIDTNSSFSYLMDLIPLDGAYNQFLSCYTYEYKFDGIYFDEKYNYSLIEEGF